MRKAAASLLAVLLLLGCSQPASSSSVPEVTPVPVAEDEYAAGNVILKIKETDMDGYRWLDDNDPAFAQVSMTESFRILEEKGTALVLFSYDWCPWCNRAVPVLNKVLKENGIKGIYVDIYEPEIAELEKEARMEVIDKLYSLLDPVLDHEKNPETGKIEPAMYVPLVIAVKDGEIVDHHTSLVSSFDLVDDDTVMTEEQNEELAGYYQRLIDKVK
ncbi:MAG: thioredoxin family protein [Solobacterium sp.]|nr:thioredoxin family protein [Solobacterium sp.]